MAGNVYTGIDIGSESVKFVTARRGKGGKLQILNAGSASIGDLASLPDGETRSEGIAAILKGLMVDRRTRIRKAYTCVSGKKVITRYAHVPPMPPKRLEKVMAFEIDNEAPGDEEVAADFKLLDLPNKDAEFTILVGMAKEEAIEGQRKTFDAVGIKMEDVTLGSLPLFHSFIYSKRAELDSMKAPWAVVDIGAERMEMIVLYGRKLYFARSQAPGGNVFTEAIRQELRIPLEAAEKIKRKRGRIGDVQPPADDSVPLIPMDDSPADDDVRIIPIVSNPDDEDTALGFADDKEMIQEIADNPPSAARPQGDDPVRRALETSAHSFINSIRSCLRFFKVQTKLQNVDITRIYITGGGANLPGLARHIQRRLRIETLEFDPLENVDYSAVDPAGKEMLEADPFAFATALGLVAGRAFDSSMDMSLLPKADKERQEFMKRSVYGWAAAAAFTISIVAMAAGSYTSTRKLDRFTTTEQKTLITRAQSKETQLKNLQDKNADLAAKVARLGELALESRTYLAAISVLKGKTQTYEFPRDVTLSQLRTYSNTNPPAPKTREGKANKYGQRALISEKPKVLTVAGSVSDTAGAPQARKVVRGLIDYLKDVEGPLGRKIFKQATPEYAEERNFRIKFVLNEE
ncbi:MAG: type IV pilus assembly protein PilM [Planctomycetes bacterium]|nr:type IV pilus assembly protein PilM [Planctomycetota bacterium]